MPKKSAITLMIITLLLLSLAACGSSKSNADADPSYGKAGMESGVAPAAEVQITYSEPMQTTADTASGEAPKGNASSINLINNSANSGHKVILTGEITIETLKFEESVTSLTEYVSSIGGYIESSSIQGNRIADYQKSSKRNARFVFRIPQVKFTQLFTDIKAFGTVTSEQSRGEDITDKYFDTEARLKSLAIQEERLLSLLQKAEKMEDILAIERELQNTRYQIENLTGTIRKWDSLISFSTVAVSVNEVEEIKPIIPSEKNNLFKRISYGFLSSVNQLWDFSQDLIVFLVSAIPFIIPIAIICFAMIFIYRKRKKANPPN